MMSLEEFEKMLQPRIDAGTPFLAYWHPAGMMVLNTDCTKIMEFDVFVRSFGKTEKKHAKTALQRDSIILNARRSGKNIDRVQEVEKFVKTKASSVNKLRKILTQLQKDPRIGPVYVVEFNGVSLSMEGDDLDALSALCVSARGD